MNFTGLRFLLEHGSFLQVVVPESEAKKLVKDWVSGALIEPIVGGVSQYGAWAVKVDSIRGIHTVPIETMGMTKPPGLFPGASGLRN